MTFESSYKIELIVTHHKRRRSRPPFSATAYLVDSSKTAPSDLLDAGRCEEAGSGGEAARDALRDLQQRRERLTGVCDAVLNQALLDPLGAITLQRVVG